MLHHNKETFEQVILRVAHDKGIAPEIIEKDYYVTLFLKRIRDLQPNIIFKGGTSLSKCYKIINRFFRYKIYPKHPEKQLMNLGNNPIVGMTVACAVAIEEASK